MIRPAVLRLHEIERLAAGEALHLGSPLDRDEGSQRFPFALDDELVGPKGDPVQHVADPLQLPQLPQTRPDHGYAALFSSAKWRNQPTSRFELAMVRTTKPSFPVLISRK